MKKVQWICDSCHLTGSVYYDPSLIVQGGVEDLARSGHLFSNPICPSPDVRLAGVIDTGGETSEGNTKTSSRRATAWEELREQMNPGDRLQDLMDMAAFGASCILIDHVTGKVKHVPIKNTLVRVGDDGGPEMVLNAGRGPE